MHSHLSRYGHGLSASLLLVALLGGCGYRWIGRGSLPSGLTCVSMGQIRSDSPEVGLEAQLTRDLENALDRRGLSCGNQMRARLLEGAPENLPGETHGGRLEGVIEPLRRSPSTLTTTPSGTTIATYRITTSLEMTLLVDGVPTWRSERLELSGVLVPGMTGSGSTAESFDVALRDTWRIMSLDAADRVVQQLSLEL